MTEYVFRRVTNDDYGLLQELYLNAYQINTRIDDIKKLFDTSSLGCEQIGFIAIEKNTGITAGFYGVFPHKMFIDGKVVTVCQAGSAMTHTEHRNKGLFIALANKTFSVCREKGMQLVYGFPNENSYHGHIKKLNWVHTDNIVRWDLKPGIWALPFPKIAAKLKLFQRAFLPYAKLILRSRKTDLPQQFHNSLDSNYAKVYRDKNYIGYKKSPGTFFIKVDNQILWIKLTDVLWIGDFSDYSHLRPELIKKLKRLAFLLGYNTISFHINESLPLPAFFSAFRKYNADALCVMAINPTFDKFPLLFTGVDFDTW